MDKDLLKQFEGRRVRILFENFNDKLFTYKGTILKLGEDGLLLQEDKVGETLLSYHVLRRVERDAP